MNYSAETEKLIAELKASGKKPKLLLHCCCAPCASACIEYLAPHFELTAYYYNPNITRAEEYAKRRDELKRLCGIYGVEVKDGGYDGELFLSRTRGLENEPERGRRCRICFFLRLGTTAREAAAGGYDYFATTLTLSPLKDAVVINSVGDEMAEIFGVKYLRSDFKKKDGYKRSLELSREYGLYRQNYCGCVYSERKN